MRPGVSFIPGWVHPGVKFWFRLHGWFHPGMKGKQFHPGMKSMSKATSVFLVFGFCFYKMAVLAVNWYAQFDHSPLVIRKEAQKNVISARDRKEWSVYMDFWSRDEISSRCWRPGWNRPGMSKFHPGIMQTPKAKWPDTEVKLIPGWNSSRDEFSHVNSA